MKTERNPSSTGEAIRNLIVTIPGDAYRHARFWAAKRFISLSADVCNLIKTLPRSCHSPALSHP
jgi:hypothetical protein